MCPLCGDPRLTLQGKRQRVMWLPDIRDKLKRTFGVKELAQAFRYALERESGDGDCWDGKVMKRIAPTVAEMVYTVHCAMCADGAVMESWKQTSYIPVYLMFLQWPPKMRISGTGMMLAALFPPHVRTLCFNSTF